MSAFDKRQEKPARLWQALDNAGKIFPAVRSDRQTSYFRLSATLKEPVRRGRLQDALDAVMTRFPYYKMSLRAGLFWYSLVRETQDPQVIPDSAYPCMPLGKRFRSPFLFRVRYYNRRIAVEFSHALTDGVGALVFLKALVLEYLVQKGHPAPEPTDIPRPGQTPGPRENEDSFLSHYIKGYPRPKSAGRAFHVPFRLSPRGVYHVTTGILAVEEVLTQARARGTSLTEFLAAVYLLALEGLALEQDPTRPRGPIRLIIPINLRKLFPSPTLRNFFLTIPLEIDPRLGRYDLEELCAKVHHSMQAATDEKFIRPQLVRNVRGEVHPLARVTPLILKNLFLSHIFRKSERGVSSSLSNLGRVDWPASLAEQVDRFEFIPPPSPFTKINCAVISSGLRLFVSFGRQMEEASVERLFFTILRKLGLAVKIETNE